MKEWTLLAESNDESPFGALDATVTAALGTQAQQRCGCGSRRINDHIRLAHRGLHAAQMAHGTVRIVSDGAKLLCRRFTVHVGLGLVLVTMVAEVPSASRLLVPAVAGRSAPGELKRQNYQQAEEE